MQDKLDVIDTILQYTMKINAYRPVLTIKRICSHVSIEANKILHPKYKWFPLTDKEKALMYKWCIKGFEVVK